MSLPAAVLWDLDGTLVDTEPVWQAAERELVESYGGTWSHAQAAALVGSDLRVTAEVLREEGGVPLPAEEVLDRLVGDVAACVRRSVPWRPGARELLAELVAAQLPCALVTMSYQPIADAVLEALPDGTFAAVVTGDAVHRGKPHPEPYLRAAASLGIPPEACVAIEDSATGSASARAAGCRVLVVPNVVAVADDHGHRLLDTLAGVRAVDLLELAPAPSRS